MKNERARRIAIATPQVLKDEVKKYAEKIISDSNMTPIWKKIDPENVPKVEVVAMNEDVIKHKYIGVIEIVNGHICTDEGWIVTHYIELPC